MDNIVVSIFGTSRAKAGSDIYKLAFETGRLLAETGFDVANGGYGGTMLASAKGAKQAGGKTIGVTCSAFRSGKANEYVSEEIVTRNLDERLDTLLKLAAAYIVLPGGTGTLLELAKVWELKNKGFVKADKPIILIGEFWKPLIEIIVADDPSSRDFLTLVQGPGDAKDCLVGEFKK